MLQNSTGAPHSSTFGRRSMPWAVALTVLVGLALTACTANEPVETIPNFKDGLLGRAATLDPKLPEAKLPAKPTKVKAWPAMRAWMSGERLDREPTKPVQQPLAELERYGKAAYGMYCANCHGADGKGDGPRAPMFSPPPRDFTTANYRYRSTPTGQLPTSDDLFRTITGGLHGTGMPAFADLQEVERWAIVAYLRTFSPKFAKAPAAQPLRVPPTPTDMAGRVERGRKIYAAQQCASCHGDQGVGDGPLAKKLVNALGQPIKPRNFALEPLKFGDGAREIYRVLATGLDGTPMQSYRAKLRSSERWDLAAYVASLTGEGNMAKVSERDVAEAKKFLASQRSQAKHAVVGGCGCQARRRKR